MIPSTRRITCSNQSGFAMAFDGSSFSPFILATVDGLYGKKTNVTISQNVMIDGGTYQGSVASVRNIVMTLLDQPDNFDNQSNRDALYHLFSQGEKGRLVYEENGVSRYIDYYVESITRKTRKSIPITVSLLCPDPFLYDTTEQEHDIANIIADFEFIHEFTASGEELSHRSPVRSVTIDNDSAATNIGLEIHVTTKSASVTNPSLAISETGESITIGSATLPFVLEAGQELVITTATGNKHVYLLSGGEETEVNGYLTEDSRFIQLKSGANTIGFDADSGVDAMIVTVKYRFKYEGA